MSNAMLTNGLKHSGECCATLRSWLPSQSHPWLVTVGELDTSGFQGTAD